LTNCFSCTFPGNIATCNTCMNSAYLFGGACYSSCESFRDFTTEVSTVGDNGFGRYCGAA
jgi:hypothetical protein